MLFVSYTFDQTWTYDVNGNQRPVIHTDTWFDASGNITSKNETIQTYDSQGRQLSSHHTDSSLNNGVLFVNHTSDQTWTYDVNGNQSPADSILLPEYRMLQFFR